MSPRPSSTSAPLRSRMVRESTFEATWKATRAGMFALIRPVITSTDGRCVAQMRWMPMARAFWERRMTLCSTSLAATIISSPNSSTMITMWGMWNGTSSSSASPSGSSRRRISSSPRAL